MKRCPVCQSTYADDSLRFCLQDGATLSGAQSESTDEFKTWVLPEDVRERRELLPTEKIETDAADSPDSHVTVGRQHPSPTSPQPTRLTTPITTQALASQPQARSTAAVVGLTAIATLVLLALGGLGAWWLLRDQTGNGQRNERAGNTNTTTDNRNNQLPGSNTRPSPNANAASTPSASPVVTPTATPPPTDGAVAEKEVRAALNDWLYSFRARDLDIYMARYASLLEVYYRSRSVSAARVREDKARAFAKYSTIEVSLSNIQVQTDTTGLRAVVIFNKSWRFSGPDVNPYTGSGLNRFTFKKIKGAWYIIGEEDL